MTDTIRSSQLQSFDEPTVTPTPLLTTVSVPTTMTERSSNTISGPNNVAPPVAIEGVNSKIQSNATDTATASSPMDSNNVTDKKLLPSYLFPTGSSSMNSLNSEEENLSQLRRQLQQQERMIDKDNNDRHDEMKKEISRQPNRYSNKPYDDATMRELDGLDYNPNHIYAQYGKQYILDFYWTI
jgi:hypothetical protein